MKVLFSAVLFAALWGIQYLYGSFILIDNIVPDVGMSIDEWIADYYLTALLAIIGGFACTLLWYFFGSRFSGGSSIMGIYIVLFLAALGCGVLFSLLLLPNSQEGSGLAGVFVCLFPLLGFYLNSLFFSHDNVKYIPFGAEKIHG